MRVLGIVVMVSMAGCGVEEPATSEVQSNATSSQGSSMQGSSMQGTSLWGSSFQGASYLGATLGGLTASNVAISGTLLVTYTHNADGTWDERIPYRICHYNSDRTVRYGCTYPDLTTAPSPLAGLTFTATFITQQNTTTTARIQVASAVGSVVQDTGTQAMFPITGGANGTITTQNCENPAGCRVNSDLYLYDIRLPDYPDANGQPITFCPPGERAFALKGTWDTSGQFHASSTQFTFACTNGTIAKCTRWGYRPFAINVAKSDGSIESSLAPYHQACIRAAMADYCGIGFSFTHNGTLVDVYDYPQLGQNAGAGFIPSQRWQASQTHASTPTVFTWESRFDPSGATDIDHTRYEELPPLSSPANYCPGRFITQGGGEWPTWYRNGSIPVDTAHLVMIDSAPACAHSERTVGKWLQTHDLFSAGCSTCIQTVAGYNAACSSATGKWDASCVALALQHCGSSTMMTAHGECTTGAALPKYATGCTLKLALANVAVGTTLTSDCVDSTKAWNQDCVRAAASLCTGGQETFGKLGTPITDFCGQKIGIGGF